MTLLIMLAGTILLHFVLLAAFHWTIEDTDQLESAVSSLSNFFAATLPAVTALVGAAIAFYFTSTAESDD